MSKTRRTFLALSGGLPLAAAQRGAGTGGPAQARLVRRNGELKVEVGGRVYEPLAFRSFRATEKNIRQFYDAGVRLMSVLHTGMDCTLDVPYSPFGEIWTGPGQYNFENFDRQMDLFMKCAPEAHFNVMLQLDTRDWYLKAHPEYSNTFRNLVEMAGHEPWRKDAAQALQDIMRYAERKYGDRVFAYSLFCGSSTEWYTNSQSRRTDAAVRPHPIKEAAYRKVLGSPEATLPHLHELYQSAEGVLRHPERDAAALRYWRFHNEIIADAILYFAARAQEVIEHRKLLGVFYGYLNTLRGKRLLEEGHLGYEAVWKSPNIDMIFSPARYGEPRSFGGASGYLATVDSLALHGKLSFQEIDHTTYVAPTTVANGRRIPGSDSKLKDEFETRMVLRREFLLTRVKRTGMWWFDFFGGYYDSDPLRKEVANLVKVSRRLEDIDMRSVAQIAVFGDTQSMYYTSSLSRLSDDLLVNPPDVLARVGAPWDIYTFSDIANENIPWQQYRMVVFLNCLRIGKEQREFIEKRVAKDGRTLVWIWAANFIQADQVSADGISAVTGMRIAGHDSVDGSVKLDASGARFGFSERLFPLFRIADESVTVLGRYAGSGIPALGYKRLAEHTSVYSAVPNLPADLYRELARQAGVHIYSSGTDPVYVNSRLIGVHMQSPQAPDLHLASGRKLQAEELFDGGLLEVRDGRLRIPHQPGAVKLYLLKGGELNG